MVFGAILGGAKKIFGGGGKKKAPPPKAAAQKPDTLESDAARTTKQLLSPVKGTRKPIRMRPGARKAMSRGSSRAGGR
jgi:hypothetical protein